MEFLDFLDICDKDPELANALILNKAHIKIESIKSAVNIPHIIPIISSLNSTHIGKLINICGTVIKSYPIYFKSITGEQQCYKCNEKKSLNEIQMKNKKNLICTACGSTCINVTEVFSKASPIQCIRIQDINALDLIPETIEVILENDFTSKYNPGDKLDIIGSVVRKWKILKKNEEMMSTLSIKAINIIKIECFKTCESDIDLILNQYSKLNNFEKRKLLLNSFSKDLIGLEAEKLGILCAAVSTSTSIVPNTTRSTIHILLIGDSSTGKTTLLKNSLKIITPSILINGMNTTDAGLTSCATKSGKDWILEAGALVLADRGVCCIDEFDKLKLNEKSGLLEAMEQQTISLAKAGIVTRLNTRCSIIGACSVCCNHNNFKLINNSLKLSIPLITRFDLIFKLVDDFSQEKDDAMIDFIIKNYNKKIIKTNSWEISTLQSFINHCKELVFTIPEKICNILLMYYNNRKETSDLKEYTTVRMLESLIRLTIAHAKLMIREEILEDDAYVAILLMEHSIYYKNYDFMNCFTNENEYNKILQQLNIIFIK